MDKCSLKFKENNKKIRRLIRATAETSSVCDSPTNVKVTLVPTFPTTSVIATTSLSAVVAATVASSFPAAALIATSVQTMGGGVTTPQALPSESFTEIPYISPILTTCATCSPGSLLLSTTTATTSPSTTTDNKIGLKSSDKFSVSVFDTGGSSGQNYGSLSHSKMTCSDTSTSKNDGFNNNDSSSPSIATCKSSEIEIPQPPNRITKFSFKSTTEEDPYQYTIASPNNPFLPEIIAKRCSMDMSADNENSSPPYQDFVASSPTSLAGGIGASSGEQPLPSSPVPAGTLSPMTIFGLAGHGHATAMTGANCRKTSNPFLSSQCTSPQCDLNTKREEFLKATMKICLVVSPPSNKLQLKSKSLTDLDILDSISCQRSTTIDPPKQRSEQKESTHSTTATIPPTSSWSSSSSSTTHHHHHHHFWNSGCGGGCGNRLTTTTTSNTTSCNKICCLGSFGSTTTAAVASQTYSSISPSQSFNCNNLTAATLSSVLLPSSTSPSATTVHQSNQHPNQTNVSCKKKSSFMNRNKKPFLSRSQVSSSEYFSVSFCTSTDRQEEELIPAAKGITLIEAINPILKKRNLSFSQIAIYDNTLQNYTEPTGSPPYFSSLDENADIETLAGKHLVVVDRDGSKRPGQLQKAASFGARTRPPRLLSSASTEETTESEQKNVPGKQLKQRWSGLFGMKNNQQQNQLCQLLDDYDRRGVPQKIHSMSFQQPEFQNALNYLDKQQQLNKSWRDFVQCDDMSDSDIKIQSAIWELVTTEIDYIHVLKTVTDLFLACLDGIQDNNLLTDVDQNKLFSNIYDIYEANVQFWSHYLYPMVENSINTGSSLRIDYFQEGFINFAMNFAPYKKYCAEQSTCQFYCKELNRNNPLFTYYLTWCEAQKMCNRLRLADILVRPMQRLTKYSLLLLAIRKHIAEENDGDNMDAMIHSVENFVCSVNTHLTTRQENERLKGIMARIESYDVVDSNNEHLDKITKQYSTMFDLCSPMRGVIGVAQGRHLFMEGDLKFKDSIGKSDVHCFLLTDILLVCKTIAKKGQGTLKVIRQPYITDRLVVKQKDNILYCVYLNEFQMAVTAFTLQCAEAKSWYEAMNKAKHIYSRLKQGTNWDGYSLRQTNSGSFNNADTLSIKKSPMNSSLGSRVSSLNNSHSGSVELNDSRNISVDFEKTNSLSSDEGSFMSCNQTNAAKPKTLLASPQKIKTSSSNQLAVQPHNNLGQSLPNLNIQPSQSSNLYHTYSNNTLLVPGSSNSGYLLLSPSHRGISYPPPSPTRATLRRGFAFSSSIKNPPLLKTRNITSQNSFASPPAAVSGTQPQTQALPPTQQQPQHQQPQQQQPQHQQPVLSPNASQPHQQFQLQSNPSNSLQGGNESNV